MIPSGIFFVHLFINIKIEPKYTVRNYLKDEIKK